MSPASPFDTQVVASLSTICNGDLDQTFQKEVPALLAQLQHGQKAKLTIELEFSRVNGTDTMINITAKTKPTYPSRARTSVGQITGDFGLKVDKPESNVRQLSLADKGVDKQ